MGGLLWNTAALSSESQQPPFGATPAPLDGPELPSFRYPLGSQPTKQFNGGTAKEANVTGFPVSETLAGVYMTLKPGALRELHWHANAAEWAYVLEGNCRVTTIDPQGQWEIVDFGPGDVWYFPRGHGHSIQGLGPGTCVFLLVFDNGYFSEFGTFSISDWLGHTPAERRQPIVAAALVVMSGIGSFAQLFDELGFEQPLDHRIEGAGTQTDTPVRAFGDVLQDRVAMAIAIGQ